jgi:hypothetical protein
MTREGWLMKLGLACLIVGLAAVLAGVLFGRTPVATAVVAGGASVKPAPSAAEQDRSDGAALGTLQRSGANLAKRTTITHYLYVPELGDARAAADALERRGFDIVLERPLGAATNSAVRTDWGVVASRAETPTIEHLRAARAVFRTLARRYHGSYDGWEAAVVR